MPVTMPQKGTSRGSQRPQTGLHNTLESLLEGRQAGTSGA